MTRVSMTAASFLALVLLMVPCANAGSDKDGNQTPCNEWGCMGQPWGSSWIDPLWVHHQNVFWRCKKPGLVAMTFDDGPLQDMTAGVLDELKALDVKATFFVNNNDWAFNLMKRAYQEGHQIASHTKTHRSLKGHGVNIDNILDVEVDELERSVNEALAPVGGKMTKYLRPPYLDLDETAADALQRRGYKVVQISIDTNDWKSSATKGSMLKAFTDHLGSPDSNSYISLQHDTKKKTQEVIKPAVEALRAAGFKLVTVKDCLSGKGGGNNNNKAPTSAPPTPPPSKSSSSGGDLLTSTFTYYWMKFQSQASADKKGNTELRTCGGTEVLATVDRSFAEKVRMEGSSYLADGTLINLGGCSCGSGFDCFMRVDKKKAPWGLGAWTGTRSLSLEPYVSIASNDHKLGDTLYIPALDGMALPDLPEKSQSQSSLVHNGCVRVDDVSWSFGSDHLDFFVAREENYKDLIRNLGANGKIQFQEKKCKTKTYAVQPPEVKSKEEGDGKNKDEDDGNNSGNDNGKCAEDWGKCGGVDFTGATSCCGKNYHCVKSSKWYSQCVPKTTKEEEDDGPKTQPPTSSIKDEEEGEDESAESMCAQAKGRRGCKSKKRRDICKWNSEEKTCEVKGDDKEDSVCAPITEMKNAKRKCKKMRKKGCFWVKAEKRCTLV